MLQMGLCLHLRCLPRSVVFSQVKKGKLKGKTVKVPLRGTGTLVHAIAEVLSRLHIVCCPHGKLGLQKWGRD